MKSYSTFDIARICGVNRSTVQQWVDKGQVRAFRTPGGHRRVTEKNLVRFLKKYEFPMPEELARERRALVVDDQPEVLDLLSKGLAQRGFRVASVDNGVDALLEVGEEPPDLLVLDILMPGWDGYEVLRRIRARPQLAGMKIVAISGAGHEDTEQRSRALGADAFLSKPFTLDQLEEVALSLLEGEEAASG